jgi:hypothetical protein
MAGDRVPVTSSADINRTLGDLPDGTVLPGRNQIPETEWMIRDLVSFDAGNANHTLRFKCLPDEVGEEVTANYSEMGEVIGRSAPIIGYSNTGARMINFQLLFFAEADARAEVFNKVQWLQSLKYPEYEANFMSPPHLIRVIGGSFLYLKGILESCSVQYGAPYRLPDGLPMKATVALNIKEVVQVPYDWRDVRGVSKIGGWSE